MSVDLGMFLLRMALGPMLVLHGWNKAFGPDGIAGTARWFDALGLRPGRLHARVASSAEIAAGIAMSLGLLTAATSAAFVGLMAVAAVTDHRGKGYFVFKGGFEYVLMVAMVAVGLAVVGPGDWSVDSLLGLNLSGPGWAGGATAAGLGGAGLLMVTSYRPAKDV